MLDEAVLDGYRSHGGEPLALHDTLCPGLLAEVQPGGVIIFYRKVAAPAGRGKARPAKVRLGGYPAMSLPEARMAARMDGGALDGDAETPAAEPAGDAPALMTLRDFLLVKYLPYVATYKRSAETDARIIDRTILPYFKDKTLAAITEEFLIAFQTHLLKRGYAPATCNRPVVIIRYAFNLAIRWGYAEKNPASGMRLLKENNIRQVLLDKTAIQALLFHAQRSKSRFMKYIIPLLIFTGARKSEILNAHWSYLDLPNRTLEIPQSKSGNKRYIILNDAAVAVFNAVPVKPGCPYIFPSARGNGPIKQFQDAWDDIRVAAGLPDLRLHDLRHTFASQLVNSGCSLYIVQQLLGHANPRTTMRYAHLSSKALIDAANHMRAE